MKKNVNVKKISIDYLMKRFPNITFKELLDNSDDLTVIYERHTNQQPKLSDDVEELLRTVYEEDYYNTNSTPEYISNKLKQHIQAQENKLKEQVNYIESLQCRHDSQDELINTQAIDLKRLNEKYNIMCEAVSDLAGKNSEKIDKLDAIREVIEQMKENEYVDCESVYEEYVKIENILNEK